MAYIFYKADYFCEILDLHSVFTPCAVALVLRTFNIHLQAGTVVALVVSKTSALGGVLDPALHYEPSYFLDTIAFVCRVDPQVM